MSRAIDKLVATKIMGKDSAWQFYPSVDPAAAMAVVDKIKKDNPTWTFQLTESMVVHEAAFFTNVYTDATYPVQIVHRGASDTREKAITLAALRAVACPESEIETALKGSADE